MPFECRAKYDNQTIFEYSSEGLDSGKHGEDENLLDSWGKHHEHTHDYADTMKNAISKKRVAGWKNFERQQITPDNSDNEKTEVRNESGRPPKLRHIETAEILEEYSNSSESESEGYIEVLGDDEESLSDGAAEIDAEVESVISVESNSKTMVHNDIKTESSAPSTVSVDVGAMAAMVGGFICATVYLWRGNKQKAKESMALFTRGFNTVCDSK